MDDGRGLRARVVGAFDQFHDARASSDDEIAKLLSKLEIDIAVDLTGYTRGGRPGIFSHRPAPIQVSYLVYPGKMGADFIDYDIADKTVLPFGQTRFWTEKIVHLPDTYWVTDSSARISGKRFEREEVGLPAHGFVFCCSNN